MKVLATPRRKVEGLLKARHQGVNCSTDHDNVSKYAVYNHFRAPFVSLVEKVFSLPIKFKNIYFLSSSPGLDNKRNFLRFYNTNQAYCTSLTFVFAA